MGLRHESGSGVLELTGQGTVQTSVQLRYHGASGVGSLDWHVQTQGYIEVYGR